MSFNIRKPFARRQTDHAVAEGDDAPRHDTEGKTVPDTAFDEMAITTGVDQLEKFKKTHKWDYNLDYDTIVRFTFLYLSRLSSV